MAEKIEPLSQKQRDNLDRAENGTQLEYSKALADAFLRRPPLDIARFSQEPDPLGRHARKYVSIMCSSTFQSKYEAARRSLEQRAGE